MIFWEELEMSGISNYKMKAILKNCWKVKLLDQNESYFRRLVSSTERIFGIPGHHNKRSLFT